MKTTKNYMNEAWDWLIVLDATRFDVFKEVVNEEGYEGKLTRFDTKVPNTPFWYRKYWSYEDNDAVLITANPQPFIKAGWDAADKFYKAFWADPESKDIDDREKVRKRTRNIAGSASVGNFHPSICMEFVRQNKIPGRRHVVHFIPPHLPYVGEKGKKFLDDIGAGQYANRNVYHNVEKHGRKGNWDEVRGYYKESLKAILKFVMERMDEFPGKVVITADHAEMIGEPNYDEKGFYNHNVKVNKKENPELWQELFDFLGKVPWFEVKK